MFSNIWSCFQNLPPIFSSHYSFSNNTAHSQPLLPTSKNFSLVLYPLFYISDPLLLFSNLLLLSQLPLPIFEYLIMLLVFLTILGFYHMFGRVFKYCQPFMNIITCSGHAQVTVNHPWPLWCIFKLTHPPLPILNPLFSALSIFHHFPPFLSSWMGFWTLRPVL